MAKNPVKMWYFVLFALVILPVLGNGQAGAQAPMLLNSAVNSSKPTTPAESIIVVPVGTKVIYRDANGNVPPVPSKRPRFEKTSVMVYGTRTEVLQDNQAKTICYSRQEHRYHGADWSCVPLHTNPQSR